MFVKNRASVINARKCIFSRDICQPRSIDLDLTACGYFTHEFESEGIGKTPFKLQRNQVDHNSINTTSICEEISIQSNPQHLDFRTGQNSYTDKHDYSEFLVAECCNIRKPRSWTGLNSSIKDFKSFITMSFKGSLSSRALFCWRKIHMLEASSFSRSLHMSRKLNNNLNICDISGIKTRPPWKIMFFGSDKISIDTLSALNENMNGLSPVVESLDVVTLHGKPPVQEFAERVGLRTLEWPIQRIHGKYEVGIVASFGRMIPKTVIQMFPYGILNMHPSMLPRWRGASPIIHTVLNGDEMTGISVMEIRPKHFDTGPILLQRPFRVPDRVTSFQLADHLGKYGAQMVIECLQDLPTLERFEHEQDHKGITYAHKIQPVNTNINWEDQTVHELDCQYRAISQLMPLRSLFKGQKVKLKDMLDPKLTCDIQEGTLGKRAKSSRWRPGTVLFHKQLDCLLIKCKDGFAGFRTIVFRKELSAKEFYNGYLNQTGWACFTSMENELNKFTDKEYMKSAS